MWESNYEPDARRHRCRPCRCTPGQAGRDGDRPARPLAPAVPRARAARRRLDRLVGARPQARGESAPPRAPARTRPVRPPTVTAVVDGLVARGLVERQSDPEDRRRLTLLLPRD